MIQPVSTEIARFYFIFEDVMISLLPEELIVTASELVMLEGSSGVMMPSAGGARTDPWLVTRSNARGTFTGRSGEAL